MVSSSFSFFSSKALIAAGTFEDENENEDESGAGSLLSVSHPGTSRVRVLFSRNRKVGIDQSQSLLLGRQGESE
jgi:hypothetical protein